MFCRPAIRDGVATCSCGWSGPSRDGDDEAAEADIAVHLGHAIEVTR